MPGDAGMTTVSRCASPSDFLPLSSRAVGTLLVNPISRWVELRETTSGCWNPVLNRRRRFAMSICSFSTSGDCPRSPSDFPRGVQQGSALPSGLFPSLSRRLTSCANTKSAAAWMWTARRPTSLLLAWFLPSPCGHLAVSMVKAKLQPSLSAFWALLLIASDAQLGHHE